MFQDTKPETHQKENLQPISAITWDEGLTFMVTADQVEVGESVRTWQRNDWLGMESLWHQSVSLRLSGYFQAALKSGLKRPSVVRQGKTLQSMNLKNCLFLIIGRACCCGRMSHPYREGEPAVVWVSPRTQHHSEQQLLLFPPVTASTAITHGAARSHCSAGRHKKLPDHGEHKHTTRLLFVPPKGSPTETTHFWTLCGFF